jgi:hypothetical protein
MCGSCNHPLTQDPDGVIVGDCGRLEGGVIKPSAPGFSLTVENESDPLWREDDLTLVLEDDDSTIVIDNA